MHLVDNQFILDTPAARGQIAPGGLFHAPAFYRLHAAEPGTTGHFFEWCEGDQVLGTLHVTRDAQGVWRSPARGTFAGYATHGLPLEVQFAFHDAVEAQLRAEGGSGIEILLPPQAHQPAAVAQQFYLLRARGFAVSRCDLNQSLSIDATPVRERMSYGNRKRLAKCQRAGYTVQAVGTDELPAVYDCIAENRAGKGYPMSMTLAALQAMDAALPGRLALFACRHDGAMAAAAICLRLDAQTLYVFYWGDTPGHTSHSPVVMVAEAIHDLALHEGLATMDVGTSTIDTDAQFGLLHFKQGLGMSESLKFRMEKRW